MLPKNAIILDLWIKTLSGKKLQQIRIIRKQTDKKQTIRKKSEYDLSLIIIVKTILQVY